jgi:predicted small lipoprotein YifL
LFLFCLSFVRVFISVLEKIMNNFSIAGLLCLSALTGCGAMPTPTYFPPAHQEVVASASQWKIIARDFATELAPKVQGGVFVTGISGRSPFSDAFDGMLESALLEHGVPTLNAVLVGTGGRPGPTVAYSVQVVDHQGHAPPMAIEIPGQPTVFLAPPPPRMAGRHHNHQGLVEVVVTVAAYGRGGVIFHDEKVYYVQPKDLTDYRPAPMLIFHGEMPPPPPPVFAIPKLGR